LTVYNNQPTQVAERLKLVSIIALVDTARE